MRDKNLTYHSFIIQLEKILEKPRFQEFFRNPVTVTPTLLEEFTVRYPRNFRLLRILSIIQWYLPETFHFRIWLDLKDKTFSHLNRKQRIEIQLLLSSKENCVSFLYETNRYSGNEIFGNILKNDLKELLKELKFYRKKYLLVRPQRRRGYSDHGSRKPDEKWLPRSDFSLIEQQLRKERKQYLFTKTINRLLKSLEKFRNEWNQKE